MKKAYATFITLPFLWISFEILKQGIKIEGLIVVICILLFILLLWSFPQPKKKDEKLSIKPRIKSTAYPDRTYHYNEIGANIEMQLNKYAGEKFNITPKNLYNT